MIDDSSKNSDPKETAYYQATLSAWYQTNFKKDKHLLNLSVFAIGLIVTLITAWGTLNIVVGMLYSFSMVCFLLCILIILNIFEKNSDYLYNIIQGKDYSVLEKELVKLDKKANCFFKMGASILVLTGFIIFVIKQV